MTEKEEDENWDMVQFLEDNDVESRAKELFEEYCANEELDTDLSINDWMFSIFFSGYIHSMIENSPELGDCCNGDCNCQDCDCRKEAENTEDLELEIEGDD